LPFAPAIGTGVYRYPAKEAAATALDTIVSELRRHGAPSRVKIVLASPELLRLYLAAAAAATHGEFWLVERGAVFSGLQRES
jgi:O-acetyl-ADP-ribose deacetylase (regulator of RNase III)